MYQYGNIKDVKVGSVVECATSSGEYTTKGKLYLVSYNAEATNKLEITRDDGLLSNGLNITENNMYWKLVLTKPGQDAKVGDTVISVSPYTHIAENIPKGDTFIVKSRVHNRYTPILVIKSSKYSADQFLTICSTQVPKKSRSTTAGTNTANKQSIPKEETMSTSITATKELTRSKTQLELATEYITEWYDEDWTFRNRVQQSAKQATKELQNPDKLGWTFRTYILTESRTTSIPTIEVCGL